MVGIFSRFSARSSHRRTQSALDEREVLPPTSEATTTATSPAAVTHGINMAFEFKPVEHPTEPLDTDQPIPCPLPEPSILNDGRIWKERVSSVGHMEALVEEASPIEAATPRTKHRNRLIPSVSAPEHNILKLLEECNASGISFHT